MGPVRQNPFQRTVRSVHMCVHCTVYNCCTQYCTEQDGTSVLVKHYRCFAEFIKLYSDGQLARILETVSCPSPAACTSSLQRCWRRTSRCCTGPAAGQVEGRRHQTPTSHECTAYRCDTTAPADSRSPATDKLQQNTSAANNNWQNLNQLTSLAVWLHLSFLFQSATSTARFPVAIDVTSIVQLTATNNSLVIGK